MSSVLARISRAFLRMVRKTGFRFFDLIMRFQVQAHLICLHEAMITKSGIRFSEKIMTKQKNVQ